MKARIEKRLIAKLTTQDPPPDRRYDIRDTDLTGFILRMHLSGKATLYAQVGRGKRELICDAADILEKRKKDRTMRWARNECRRLQGKTIDGTDYAAARRAERGIPTLKAYLDESQEGTYGWWVIHNRKGGRATLARLNHCFPDFMDLKLDRITPARMDTWRTKRLKKAKRETVNRDAGALRSALSKAVEWGLLPVHPLSAFKPVKVDRHRKTIRRLYPKEVTALEKGLIAREELLRDKRASANKWREKRGYKLLPTLDGLYVDALRPAIEVTLGTGMRKGELFNLKWEMVDFKGRVIRLPGEVTKSYTSREIPLNPKTLSTLRAWNLQCGRPTKGHVFSGTAGAVTTLKKSYYKVLKDSGIQRATNEGRITWHSLRHTFGSRLGESGSDAETIRDLMGHADLKTTQRYLHSDADRKRAAVDALSP